jgi:ABC-type multidrug transport system fused ATPase/permease subunit
LEYDHIPPEAPEIIPQHRPLPDWPTQGAITVENLVVRYRPELDPVLRGITFSVRPREKIGVVGRTGCGKSTLMLALYRIVEPSHGRVIIDGIDVSTIGLKDLRSRLALVPQDPVIFSGTIRSNLDPFGDAQSQGQSSDHTAPLSRGSTYTTNSTTTPPTTTTTTITSANADADAALWSALERAGLAAAVRAMEGGLDAPVAEGGNNLSQGQRQLLCMARALLRSARILILDEATSSIDTASDATIQATITTAFAECTVLTIAHRLHTIIASDRVLVLDAGKVKEFDSPAALMRVPGGSFKALVEEGMAHNKKGRKGSAMDLLAAVDARLDATR